MFDGFLRILLISFGSIIGANLRLHITEKFKTRFHFYCTNTLLINTTATFFLGYLVALDKQRLISSDINHYTLFFNVGLLGSLSTFSTFSYEIFQKLRRRKVSEGLLLAFTSILAGLIIAFFGYKAAYAR